MPESGSSIAPVVLIRAGFLRKPLVEIFCATTVVDRGAYRVSSAGLDSVVQELRRQDPGLVLVDAAGGSSPASLSLLVNTRMIDALDARQGNNTHIHLRQPFLRPKQPDPDLMDGFDAAVSLENMRAAIDKGLTEAHVPREEWPAFMRG